MKLHSILFTSAIVVTSLQTYSQSVSQDSINALKQQKENIEISEKLNKSKTELANLENKLTEKTNDVEKKTSEAQSAANENQQLAGKLKDDPQNKDLAKQANKSARKADRSAKAARKANDDLAKLQKDIESLRNDIAENESKIGSFTIASSLNSQQQQATPKIEDGQVVRQDMNRDSATATSIAQPDSEKSATNLNTNYQPNPGNQPQQGIPTIIINNIVASPGYEQQKPAPTVTAALPPKFMGTDADYEEYKAWQKTKRAEQKKYNKKRK